MIIAIVLQCFIVFYHAYCKVFSSYTWGNKYKENSDIISFL